MSYKESIAQPRVERTQNLLSGTYLVVNEIEFIKKLSKEQTGQYIKAQLTTFAAEFAGEVPHTSIVGTFSKEDIAVQDISLLGVAKTALCTDPNNHRVRAEYSGLANIHRLLQDGHSAIWISPSKTADYGFVFFFQNHGKGIFTEHIIRYKEQLESIGVSTLLHRDIESLVAQRNDRELNTRNIFQSAESLLKQPIQIPHGKDVDIISDILKLKSVHIAPEDVTYASDYTEATQRHLNGLIQIYTDTLTDKKLSNHLRVKQATEILHLFFHLAKEIAGVVRNTQGDLTLREQLLYNIQNKATKFVRNNDKSIFDASLFIEPTLSSGTLCPAITGVTYTGEPVTSLMGIWYRGTYKKETSERYESYQCPNRECQQWIDGEKKIPSNIQKLKNIDRKEYERQRDRFCREHWKKTCPHCSVKVSCRVLK